MTDKNKTIVFADGGSALKAGFDAGWLATDSITDVAKKVAKKTGKVVEVKDNPYAVKEELNDAEISN